MTKRQTEYLDWIKRFIEKNRVSPSFEEIRDGMGLASTATVHRKIGELLRCGVISRRNGRRRRDIEIVVPKTSNCPSCLYLSRELAAARQEITELRAHA